ncbi:MAG: metal-dependent hydrolase [Candidatus Scalindua rubra]|uniref:Endoribonuclease YbeY n=1 Tax=Candidatus Scalindua rubra TaxID=1872076 RepID=A0A1E3XAE7_9BACT|nr:MAG: metal-dependent hydrolase [Candidatus Scalindua rubra]
MIVEIVNVQRHYEIKKSKVKKVVREAVNKEGRDAKLSIVFVDNNEIKKLNKRFFNSDEVTDVIAFPLNSNKSFLSGEVVVSVETAVDTADRRKIDVEGEIFLYVVHGILHLLGYNDGNEKDAKIMHEKESKILTVLGYNVPKVENEFL